MTELIKKWCFITRDCNPAAWFWKGAEESSNSWFFETTWSPVKHLIQHVTGNFYFAKDVSKHRIYKINKELNSQMRPKPHVKGAVSSGMGNPRDKNLQVPGKALLTSAAGSLEQPDVLFLSTPPQGNLPYVPCAAAGHRGICWGWRQWLRAVEEVGTF